MQPLERQRVMFVLFPEGITVRDDAYRTPLTSYILRHLRDISCNKSQMVILNLEDYIEIYKDLIVMNEVLKDLL